MATAKAMGWRGALHHLKMVRKQQSLLNSPSHTREPPGVLGISQHPMHNLPQFFVYSHVAGGGHSPTLKRATYPLPSPQGKVRGLLLPPLGRPPPSSVSPKYWHLSSFLLIRSLGQITGPQLLAPRGTGEQLQSTWAPMSMLLAAPVGSLSPIQGLPVPNAPQADCDIPQK